MKSSHAPHPVGQVACLSCDRRHAVTRPSVVCSLMAHVCGVPKHIPIMRTRHSGERMVTGSRAIATPTPVLSDAVLVERIAALGDRAALAELDARYGMTLYAIAYTLLLNPDAADVTVAATLREAWRRGGAVQPPGQTAGGGVGRVGRKEGPQQMGRRGGAPAHARAL